MLDNHHVKLIKSETHLLQEVQTYGYKTYNSGYNHVVVVINSPATNSRETGHQWPSMLKFVMY